MTVYLCICDKVTDGPYTCPVHARRESMQFEFKQPVRVLLETEYQALIERLDRIEEQLKTLLEGSR